MQKTPPTVDTRPHSVWIDELFASIDAMDAAGFADFLTDDATFYFGNAPGMRGRAEIETGIAEFFSSIKGLRHEVQLVVTQADIVVCNGEVSYTRHDGRQVTLPFSDTFHMHGGKIRDYRIYMDVSPLYAA